MEPFGIIGGVVVAAKLLGKQVAECGRQFGMTPCGTGRLFAFGKRLGKQCRHGKGQMAQGQPPKGGSGVGSAAFEQLPEQLQFPAAGCRKSYGCGVSGPLFEPEPQLARHTGGIDEEQQRIERLATEKGMNLPGQYGHERVTIQNLEVVKVDAARNALLIKGAIPGPKGSIVTVSDSVKKSK